MFKLPPSVFVVEMESLYQQAGVRRGGVTTEQINVVKEKETHWCDQHVLNNK